MLQIGNAVSDAHGMGALGTSLGALFVADSYDQAPPTYKCTRKTIYGATRKSSQPL